MEATSMLPRGLKGTSRYPVPSDSINIAIEVCGRCGSPARVIACIEDQDIIDRVAANLRDKKQVSPTLPHLVPPSRAPPETLPLFAGSESATTTLNNQQRRY
jgi:hypothetical protein